MSTEQTTRSAPGAERLVLGSLMRDRTLSERITLEAKHFYEPRNAELYKLIVAQAEKGDPTDPSALVAAMGGATIPGLHPAEIRDMWTEVSIPEDALYHQKTIRELFARREVEVLGEILQRQSDGAESAEELLTEAHRRIEDALTASSASRRVRTFEDALKDTIDEWQRTDPPGTPTGWADLDRKLNGGWRPGQLTILGARPAVGKSLVAGAAAVQAHTGGVLFCSLEMSESEVVARMTANRMSIDLSHISQRQFTGGDWEKIAQLQKHPLPGMFLSTEPGMTASAIRRELRNAARNQPVRLVVVDYLQLMTPASERDSRERQVSRISEDLKRISQEFDTHVLALAQINRGGVEEPRMHDLRESGAIEANADNIILLHRDDSDSGEITLKVVKNRHGRTDDINLAWRPHYAAVSDLWRDAA